MNIIKWIKAAAAKLGIKINRSEYRNETTIHIKKLTIVADRDAKSTLYGLYYSGNYACTLATFNNVLGAGTNLYTQIKGHRASTLIARTQDTSKWHVESTHYLATCKTIARHVPWLAECTCDYQTGHVGGDHGYSRVEYMGRIKPFPAHRIVEWDF